MLEKQLIKTIYFNTWENDFQNDALVAPSLFLLLSYFKSYEQILYGRIRYFSIHPQELIDEVENFFDFESDETYIKEFLNIEALLIILYSKSYEKIKFHDSSILQHLNGQIYTSLRSTLDKPDEIKIFTQELDELMKDGQYTQVEMEQYLSKIDLTEAFLWKDEK